MVYPLERSQVAIRQRFAIGVLLALAIAPTCACRRHERAAEGPASSASVIPLAFALGACPDVQACERECDAGSADRCRRLAAAYAFGQEVEKNESKATALYEHSCDLGDPSSCLFAGQMHEFARGVPKDDAEAAQFYERACDMRWPPGCYNLAIMYERGTGKPLDLAKAANLYQAACSAGANRACGKAGEARDAAATLGGAVLD